MKRTRPKKPSPTSPMTPRPFEWPESFSAKKRQAYREYCRQWLKKVDSWKAHPRYLGVTFPGLKDGDRLAEELVQFARNVVAGRR